MKWVPIADIKVDTIYCIYNPRLQYLGIGKVLSDTTSYHEYMRWTRVGYNISKEKLAYEDFDDSNVIVLTRDIVFELTDDEIMEHVILEMI